MLAMLISNIIKLIVPLGLFIWALFMPRVAGYTYIVIYSLFAGYLVIIDKMKPNPDPEKWTKREIETIRKYHLALKFSFGAKDMSLFLNGFRWASFLWVILLLFNQMWFEALFLVGAFFITADVSVRLDPFFFLGQAVQSGQIQFMYELSMLKDISAKLNSTK